MLTLINVPYSKHIVPVLQFFLSWDSSCSLNRVKNQPFCSKENWSDINAMPHVTIEYFKPSPVIVGCS